MRTLRLVVALLDALGGEYGPAVRRHVVRSAASTYADPSDGAREDHR